MHRRLLGILAVTAMCVGLVSAIGAPTAGAGPSAPTATAGAADTSPDITITQTTAPSPFCLPSFFALTHSVQQTPTTFTLTINAWIRPCNAVNASAVIYQMPGNGVAWPQVLQQKQDFTISQRGTTKIVFTKHCKPVQFDVVTGRTPPVVAPWGPWHGLPLFPFDLNTSYQYFPGPDCIPGGQCDNYTPSQVVVDPTVVSPGGSVTVTGTAVPGDTITATLQSSPSVVLGSAVADEFGQFSITGTVPGSVGIGFYDVVVSSADCPTFTIVTLTVGGVLRSQAVVAELPRGPGDDMPPRALAGFGVLLAGGFALTRLSGRRARARST